MQRSIERDFDISYHKRAILRCLEEIEQHAEALIAVEYDPYYELNEAVDRCSIMKEELGNTLS